MRVKGVFSAAVLAVLLAGCGGDAPPGDVDANGFGPATPATLRAHEAVGVALPPDDGTDMQEAERGLVAREESLRVTGVDGGVLFDQDAYRFVTGIAPSTVNPSLWRQAQLNNRHGLYEVVPGIWQLRGYDLANMTLIAGDTGWIVVDPLTTRETAERALAFANSTLGVRPVSAVIFTHSHIDHFGGAQAVASPQDVAAGKLPVIAPAGFLAEATSENVMAGPAMGRRAIYMYGRDLPRNARGKVDNGLGKDPAVGNVGILAPTVDIGTTPVAMTIDGVPFVFQYTPESEAPAELTFYLPRHRAFCGAEVVSRTLHNLYTLRGARVRDALRWSGYIDEMGDLFPDSEVMFFSHHWPVFGRERIAQLLADQRDLYKYIHDQTLRLANQGYGPAQIAERLDVPASLTGQWWNRGYYGTVKHNVKAVYQHYFGWYDGNPANLDPLPRIERAQRYVDAIGGAGRLLDVARISFELGDYRWAAELLDHLVTADADNGEAREMLARAYEQMGYQAESSAWRNVFLTGAHELRRGAPEQGVNLAGATALLEQAAPEKFMEMFAVALNGPEAADVDIAIDFVFSDLRETQAVRVSRGVLRHRRLEHAQGARRPDGWRTPDATLTLTRPLMVRLVTRQAGIGELLTSRELSVRGNAIDVVRFFALLDSPDPVFPIVTGKP